MKVDVIKRAIEKVYSFLIGATIFFATCDCAIFMFFTDGPWRAFWSFWMLIGAGLTVYWLITPYESGVQKRGEESKRRSL